MTIDPQYVTYSRFRDPLDDAHARGRSPLVSAGLAIRQDRNMNRWNDTRFGPRNAIPSMVFNFKNPEKKAGDHKKIRAELLKDLSGPVQQPLVTRADEVEIKVIEQNAKDMEFDVGLERTKRVIEQVLGFPEGYFSASATRANAEAARATLIEGRVWPLLQQLKDDVNAHFMNTPECISVGDMERLEFEDIRPRDRRLDMQEDDRKMKIMSMNEIREEKGLPPWEGDKWEVGPAEKAGRSAPPMMGPAMPPGSGEGEQVEDPEDGATE